MSEQKVKYQIIPIDEAAALAQLGVPVEASESRMVWWPVFAHEFALTNNKLARLGFRVRVE